MIFFGSNVPAMVKIYFMTLSLTLAFFSRHSWQNTEKSYSLLVPIYNKTIWTVIMYTMTLTQFPGHGVQHLIVPTTLVPRIL